ncbi:carboxypeptidase D [Capsaspora owczarzaki ATCC 30864]|uniref:Carboxypeptidase D n=1 Tax=Capsaspora owczarzaki (strain ATCC 30864) TaxID=595528 RepID=A0A0D2X132_CAPO3|nr:carboxypeptidase D [Capsaspora owczarzaki ATCC 30864]KJE90104.1 carboxypeptidase D [Capsaspora owczarzaki ATCC 30864]|eukprot:XP_004364323.2 carboxypeptidase D [Capsaspora owczarzaki ATCC 30864]
MRPSSKSRQNARRLPGVVGLAMLLLLLWQGVQAKIVDFSHHNYQALTDTLQQLHQAYPDITRVFSIGQSEQGRELWVLEISNEPGIEEVREPNFKYVGNMHGNEVVGREMLLHFIEHLCSNYGIDADVTFLVQSTHIFILPSMNPDGYEAASMQCVGVQGRANVHDIDLNRDFPDQYVAHASTPQKETQLLMNWITSTPFVLSANLHGGALVASYPFDDTRFGYTGYSAAPDDNVFRRLALAWASKNPKMATTVCPGDDKPFDQGITNGAAWYSLTGGMQDFNYLHSNCFEITVEMGCCKYPLAKELPDLWSDHLPSMLNYLWQVHTGVKGTIRDVSGKGLVGVSITVQGIDHVTTSIRFGDFFRLLVPGVHVLTFTMAGFEPKSVSVTVTDQPGNSVVVLDVVLERELATKYYSLDEINALLEDREQRFGLIAELVPLGQSELENIIWAIRISDNPQQDLEPGEPVIRLVAGSHGLATETLLDLIVFLTDHYGTDEAVTEIVDSNVIYIVPLAYPDAYESVVATAKCTPVDPIGFASWRTHGGQDVSRDFPDERGTPLQYVAQGEYDAFAAYTQLGEEHPAHIPRRETLVLLNWIRNTPFTLAATLQAGALVASIPYDSLALARNASTSPLNPTPAATKDEALFQSLAGSYARYNPSLKSGKPDGCGHSFATSGTAHGWEWRSSDLHDAPAAHGLTLSDYSLIHTSAIELTFGLGCCPTPPASSLESVWLAHRDGLLGFLLSSRMGVRGTVQNENNEYIRNARISVVGHDFVVTSSQSGEYARMLPPGTYTVSVSADNYEPQSKVVVVPPSSRTVKSSSGMSFDVYEPVTLNFVLEGGFSWGIHEYFEMRDGLIDLAQKYSHIAGAYPIGINPVTPGNNKLWALEITDHPGHLDFEEPQVALIGGLHGNDAVGREILYGFARYLVRNYATDARVSRLLNTTAIYILPSANPDGFDLAEEGLCNDPRGQDDLNGYDLDHNFPDRIDGSLEETDVQAETKDIIDWFTAQDFMISVSLEGGYLAAKYPYNRGDKADYTGFGPRNSSITLDDQELRTLARVYASNHPTMMLANNTNCGYPAPDLSDPGIINGATMAPEAHSLEDWTYVFSPAAFPLAVGLGCCKFPPRTDIEPYWNENFEPLMAILEHAHTGLKGAVVDNKTGDGLYLAKIAIHGQASHPGGRIIETTELGSYRRLLVPGVYNITASHPDYLPMTKQVTIVAGPATELLFKLVHRDDSNPSNPEQPAAPDLQLFYHDNPAMFAWLQSQAVKHRSIAKLLTIGYSVQLQPLYVMRITQDVSVEHTLRPKVRIVSNVHGNEAVGRELALNLIEYLLFHYAKDPDITALIESTDIYIMPSLNPDSYNETVSRGQCLEKQTDPFDDPVFSRGDWNANAVDLYAGFPHVHGEANPPADGVIPILPSFLSTQGREPEVAAYMNWTLKHSFVLSTVLRSGALVAVYPFDSSEPHKHGLLAPTDDEEVFESVTRTYAATHHSMSRGDSCSHHATYPDGIINGATWRETNGSMLDWSYVVGGVLETAIYVDCCRFPKLEEQLMVTWEANLNPLLSYLHQAQRMGINGIVLEFRNGGLVGVPNVEVHILGIARVIKTTSLGDFWWLLPAGTYNVTFSLPGYVIHTQVVQVQGMEHIRVLLEAPVEEEEETLLSNTTVVMIVMGCVIAVVLCVVGFVLYRVYKRYAGFSLLQTPEQMGEDDESDDDDDDDEEEGHEKVSKRRRQHRSRRRHGGRPAKGLQDKEVFDDDDDVDTADSKREAARGDDAENVKPKNRHSSSRSVQQRRPQHNDNATDDDDEEEIDVFDARRDVEKGNSLPMKRMR